jgi:hypothetical protein
MTSTVVATPGKKITLKKITGITINSINVDSLNQPDEVLLICLKITNENNKEIYYNQLYEDADYSIIINGDMGAITFINDQSGFGTLESQILSAIKTEQRYNSFEFMFSKYKTGYPQTHHEPINFSINMSITHEISILDILERRPGSEL